MTTQIITKTFLLVALSLAAFTLGAQCVDYGVWPNKTEDVATSYNLNVENKCDTEVYFVVLAKKADNKIYSLLKGHLKAGEKLKHKTYGPFLSTPVGQHIAVNPSNALAARKKIDSFILRAQATNNVAGPIDGVDTEITNDAVAIEE